MLHRRPQFDLPCPQDPEGAARATYPVERLQPMSSRNEITVCVDSVDRTSGSGPEDCFVPVSVGDAQRKTFQMSLVTLELPHSQKNVESSRNRIYFDEGIRFEPGQATMEFTDLDTGLTYLLELPPYDNPIVAVSGPTVIDANTVQYQIRTQYPTGLGALSSDNRLRARLVGTLGPVTLQDQLFGASQVTLDGTDPELFYLDLPSSLPPLSTVAPFGSVRFAFPSPDSLVRAANLVLADAGLSDPQLAFDPSTGQYSLVSSDANVRVSGSGLAGFLGFSSCQSFVLSGSKTIQAQGLPGHLMYLTLPEGNYGAQGLRDETAFQGSRLSFETCCGSTNTGSAFVFSDSCGTCHTVQIPAGRWTPDQLAFYIETQMNSLAGSAPDQPYRARFLDNPGSGTGRFAFFSTDGSTFGIEINPACQGATTTPDVASRLGLSQCNYRGSDAYRSDSDMAFTGNCSRYASLDWCMFHDASNRSYSFSLNASRPVNYQVQSVTGTQVLLTPSSSTDGAYYQVGDTVDFTDPNTGQVYSGTVIQTLDPSNPYNSYVPGSILVEMGQGAAAVAGLALCSQLSDPQARYFNLYANPNLPCAINPALLGLTRGSYRYGEGFDTLVPLFDSLPDGTPIPESLRPRRPTRQPASCSGSQVAPNVYPPYSSDASYDPSGFRYVLLYLVEPDQGGFQIIHGYKGDVKANLLAKVLVYPQIRVERIYPMHVNFSEPKAIQRIGLRFMNPDHTPYQLHGLEWSATFVLSVL